MCVRGDAQQTTGMCVCEGDAQRTTGMCVCEGGCTTDYRYVCV